MKFLICGLGSIGQRHVRTIRQVLGEQAQIAAFRTRNLDVVISDNLEATFGRSPEEHYGLSVFFDFAEALAWQPDAVFVTNPISMHLPTAIAAAKAGCHVFIEKPLAHDMAAIDELLAVVTSGKLVCMVGYQLRYHPAYAQIRRWLDEGAIGRLTSAELHFGEWLPGMHPYEDYRESHAARRDQGGGVVLCLSHEIDIASWLFGTPQAVYAVGGHLSNLEMDVEDTADMILTCCSDGRAIPVHVHLDFLQKPARRFVHIVGEAGTIFFDYAANRCEIRRMPDCAVESLELEGFQRNDMFRREVSEFVNSIREGTPSPIDLQAGIASLRTCLAAKQSMVTGQVERLS